jgi:hypothetical protein
MDARARCDGRASAFQEAAAREGKQWLARPATVGVGAGTHRAGPRRDGVRRAAEHRSSPKAGRAPFPTSRPQAWRRGAVRSRTPHSLTAGFHGTHAQAILAIVAGRTRSSSRRPMKESGESVREDNTVRAKAGPSLCHSALWNPSTHTRSDARLQGKWTSRNDSTIPIRESATVRFSFTPRPLRPSFGRSGARPARGWDRPLMGSRTGPWPSVFPGYA